MNNLYMLVLGLMLIAVFTPIAVLFSYKKYLGYRLSFLKSIACIVLFELSFVPYAYVAAFSGWLDLGYFLLIWLLFYLVDLGFKPFVSIIFSFIAGFLLTTPASLFTSYPFDNIYSSLAGGFSSSYLFKEPTSVFWFLYRLGWAFVPMVGTHFVMLSMKKEKG